MRGVEKRRRRCGEANNDREELKKQKEEKLSEKRSKQKRWRNCMRRKCAR